MDDAIFLGGCFPGECSACWPANIPICLLSAVLLLRRRAPRLARFQRGTQRKTAWISLCLLPGKPRIPSGNGALHAWRADGGLQVKDSCKGFCFLDPNHLITFGGNRMSCTAESPLMRTLQEVLRCPLCRATQLRTIVAAGA